MNNNKGFTLIELLAVLVVMAIITVIAVPAITGYTKKQKERSFKLDLEKLIAISESEKIKNPTLNNTNIYFAIDCSVSTAPADGSCIDFYDIETSPNGVKYSTGYVNNNSACLSDGKWLFKKDSTGITRGEGECF